MFSPIFVIIAFTLYLAGLFAIAVWVEHKKKQGRHISRHPVIYTLSLAVYFTAWTFYGSVGTAARSGAFALAVYVGPVIAATLWWAILRRMVRVKNRERVTSIADFISVRYGKSQTVATLVTLVALIGTMPYIALQLKSIFSTFDLVTAGSGDGSGYLHLTGPLVIGLLVLFTIVLGARRLDPSERHDGIVAVVAIESLVKLAVFLSVGLFVVYGQFDGFADLFGKLESSPFKMLMAGHDGTPNQAQHWMTYIVVSTCAILLLPRQFHVAVVENHQEKAIRTALWLFPAYMGLIVLFILPIAFGGLLWGLPIEQADTFVLRLPMAQDNRWLTLMVFLGGFSAATGMVMISSMALSTMVTNHLLLPLINLFSSLDGLRRHLLKLRWVTISIVILMGYWFDLSVSSPYSLVNIGIFSFAAIAQFAPAALGGLFWRGGTRGGALLGLSSGFLLWAYTLLLPVFIRAGYLPSLSGWLDSGPFGLAFLNPESLLGLKELSPIPHGIIWSLGVNIAAYVLGSVLIKADAEEREIANRVVNALEPATTVSHEAGESETVSLKEKLPRIEKLLNRYFARPRALDIMAMLESRYKLRDDRQVSVMILAELTSEIEGLLAGAFGSATAHRALLQAKLFSREERRRLSTQYGRILADLRVTPEELHTKIDYYKERNELISYHARQLEETIEARDIEIAERRKIEFALRESEERYRLLVEASPTAIFIHSEGRMVYANPVGARMLKAESVSQLIGQPISRFVPAVFSQELRNQARKIYETNSELPLMEQEFLRLDGSPVPVDVTAIPFLFDGKPAFQVVAVDISQRREAELQKSHLEAQIRQQQKMEAIGTLASGVAHEINNPINAIMNYGQLISDRLESQGDLKTFAEEIVIESERIGRIVHNLLAFSRQERERPTLSNAADIVESAMMLIRTVIRKDNIELTVTIDPAVNHVSCNSQQIQQVLLNLITNARDAIKDRQQTQKIDGYISVEAKTLTDSAGAWMRMTIIDNGAGMSEETMARMFDPFYTTKPRGIGTGLGLSVSHGIVSEHKGRLFAESVPGQGTRFYLDLPIKKD
jgi:PAS domain S-box-containing protein